MGVPKFFRYISERYPCLSEVIKEYQVPVFDNLYLDLNGIVHICSHPDDGDAHFRITEETIFKDIFHYIEILFCMIKPRKIFLLAVDGVAPRAKMNQQRARRFRTAKEALALENKARERGEELPKEARFDSNCITPGTEFMVRLQEQLKYFVVNKISTDKLWQSCKIILSGHETPGEGEHKIMDYIRYMRSQPGYDPNTRHCLYGLDADLILLGLCTHEPHFSILREEVTFGKKSKRKITPEHVTFYLLHLSLMREYLELEFYSLKDTLSFQYDFERIIDDWVLMTFLVGNDFIPNLPNMHINTGALPILYNAYIEVLPTLGGYINEVGTLNLERFEAFMSKLAALDINDFTEKYADLKWFEGKTGRSLKGNNLEEWIPEVDNDEDIVFEPLEPEPAKTELSLLIKNTELILIDPNTKEDHLCKDNEDDLFMSEFVQHKTDYYMNKLEFKNVTPEVLKSQAEEYVRAIQWNLHYYYNGICSWSWYYPYHYAPFVSDIKDFSNSVFTFELGEPFKAYEQLLAVLPSASKELLPIPFQELMVNEDSLIKHFYPEDFKTDLNGKKQEWEAVVIIPFIDEDLLIKAMASCSSRLTPKEVARNCHGPMLIYEYSINNLGEYPSPNYFVPVRESHALCKSVSINEICVPNNQLIKGAYPGAVFDVYYPGFPTLKHLKYKGSLEKSKVKVFDQPSRGDNLILHILKDDNLPTVDTIAKQLLGKVVHVGWPHLVEALVVSISTNEYRYKSAGSEGQYNVEENRGKLATLWNMERQGISQHYRDRLGIDVGEIECLVHVKVMIGRKYIFTPFGQISFEKQWADISSAYPIQTIVRDILVHDEKFDIYNDIESMFPAGTTCFMIGQPGYGMQGEVLDSKEISQSGRLKLSLKEAEEPDLSSIFLMNAQLNTRFMNLHVASSKLAISRNLFNRITGILLVCPGVRNTGHSHDTPKINIGLKLKSSKSNEEIPGYSHKEGTTWLYSEQAIALIKKYLDRYSKVINFLNLNVNDEVFYESELFPDGDGKEILSDITNWLKQQPHNSIESIVCGSSVAIPDAVQALENMIDDYNTKNTNQKSRVMQVKPHLLYKPGLQIGNIMVDSTTDFFLFDRVVNIREGRSIPLGLKGTIIAIHNNKNGKAEDVLFDVLFDTPFTGGLSFNNSSPNRCYLMSKTSVLNISHGKRIFQEKVKVNTTNKNSSTANNLVLPQPAINNRNPKVQQSNSWVQGCGLQLPPPTFNPYFNYRTPPQPYMNQGPNTFVPYKSNHFPVGPPPHMLPSPFNYYQHHSMKPPNIPPTMNHSVGPFKGIALYGKPPFKKTQEPSPRNDSELLKRILKIEENNPQMSVVNNSEGQKNANALNYYTVQLLKEFQICNVGCPNYQHFQVNNKFTAKVMMPDGTYVFGEPAKSKELASENAAKEALNIISKHKISSKLTETVLNKATVSNNNNESKSQKSPIKYQILKHPIVEPPATKINKGFVPLQVVRNQNFAANSQASAVIDSKVPNEHHLQQPLQPTVTTINKESPNKTTSLKRRKRKSRIAANFHNAMKN